MSNVPGYAFTFANQALDGHNTWSNLVRLNTGADLFITDHANDNTDFHKAAMEALIRRLWTANAATRVIMISSPTWLTVDTGVNENVESPLNAQTLSDYEAMAAHYGITWVDYWDWCVTVVNAGTYDLTELTADTVHPTALGYANMAELLQAHLPLGGGAKPAALPARLYDSEEYENTPTRTNGTANGGTTGTWSTTGTRIESSEAGATVTFSATCRSYGLYRSDGVNNPNVEVSIDGGAYASVAARHGGLEAGGTRAAHTFVFRVVSGTVRIDEFWAV